jgi:hypothetical protein
VSNPEPLLSPNEGAAPNQESTRWRDELGGAEAPHREAPYEAESSTGGAKAGPWSPRAKQGDLRVVPLGCAYLGWGALAVAMVSCQGSQSEAVYQVNPGPVRFIPSLPAGAVLISTGSANLAGDPPFTEGRFRRDAGGWLGGGDGRPRGARDRTISPPPGRLAHRPRTPARPSAAARSRPTSGMTPAGWWGDPVGHLPSRYWDGGAWTEHVASGGEFARDPL